jgi:type IV secretory pathway component VirB8
MFYILLVILVVLAITVIILYKKLNSKNSNIGRVLPGTSTVVINVSLDSNGIPQQNYKQIELFPGQTALFAGPDEFLVIFKNRKTPNHKIENKSENGTVVIKVSDDILKQPEFAEEYRKNGFLRFDYAINVNGKELDPPMIIGKNR